ncbi:S8 family serine peptidase [Geoalkalibacter halelectricus]|uniref:S8 family serine peptidase n=1 Tax=Geoalkalibacter halelectricus TaxID=2847045 RepID=A0ABY5ZJ33_9BACT|nr:S8 family serine peptidase [Geoalkalibacter halelectricus]MDO3378267.1 S8 family serine peptidase [Geoalkalibacter halelectricus]UWZ79142.1 S8 family serine peptidase [Geoalkalibacter halelectricus]
MAVLFRKIAWRLAACFWVMVALPVLAQGAPLLDEIDPDVVVPQLQTVVLTGAGLQDEGVPTLVRFNGLVVPPEDVLEISAVRIVVLVPAGASSGPVQVEVGGVVSNTQVVSVTEAEFVPDELIVEPHAGAHAGRLLALSALNLKAVVPIGEALFYHLEIPDGRGIPQAIRDLFASGLVAGASADFLYTTQALPAKQNQPAPNDPRFAPDQYGPQRIRAIDSRDDTPDAQRLATGRGKIIAVIDTGVDAAHEDLQGKVIGGFDWVNFDNDPADDNSHGTHVAGIAAARANNALGIAGIAPDAQLVSEKVLDADGSGSSLGISLGIVGSVFRGAHVLNLSLGGNAPSLLIGAAVNFALANDRVVVAAAGNDGDGNPATIDRLSFPAGFSPPQRPTGLIAVANSTPRDGIAVGPIQSHDLANPDIVLGVHPAGLGGSTNAPYVDVAAPGSCILSSVPRINFGDPFRVSIGDALGGDIDRHLCAPCRPGIDDYCEFIGTSMAAPHVSGVAALMLEADPNLLPSQVECLLEITAVDRGVPGKDIAFGHGRVDAYAAVHAVQSLGGRYHLLPPECNALARGRGVGLPFGALGIEKFTNGFMADAPRGPLIPVGAPVRWTYLVWNAGNIPLAGIQVNDNRIGAINCPANVLNPGQFMVCFADGIARPGQYANRAQVTALDPAGFRLGSADPSHYFGVLAPSTMQGQGRPDQVLPVTADGRIGLAATFPEKTVAIDLETLEVTEFGGFPARPGSDVVLTPDQTQALVLEFPGSGAGLFGQLRRITLATSEEATLSLRRPVTEIAVTPNSSQALVGTTWGLEIIDLVAMTSTRLDEVRAITGISVTADGSKALIGVPQGLAVIDLPAATWTLLPVGPVLTGVALSSDGAAAAAGVAGGVVLVDLSTNSSFLLATGTPVSNILFTPDSLRAVFAALFGAVVVNLDALSFVQIPTPAIPVTDIELTADGSRALLGTTSGLSLISLADHSATDISLPAPVVTGLSLSANDLWAVLGLSSGVAVVDLAVMDFELVDTPGTPVTNVAITPDGITALVGIPSGVVLVDLGAATAEVLGSAYPLVTPTIAPDGGKALFGTLEGISLIDLEEKTVEQVHAQPPILNLLPDSGQPPLNPSGERGAPGPSDG